MNLTINLTRKCNKRCSYCYIKKSKQEIDFRRFKEIVSKVDPQIVTLTGGEPFLYSKISKIINLLNQRGCCVRIFSNGRVPAKQISNVLHEKGAELFISYNEHDKKTLKNLRLLNNKGVSICINHVFKNSSISYHERLVSEIGFIKKINFLYPLKIGVANIKMFSPTEWYNKLEKIKPIISNAGMNGFYETSFIKAEHSVLEIEKVYPCKTGFFLDTNGLIYPCCFMTEHFKGRSVPSSILSPFKCEILKKYRSEDPNYKRICPLILSTL